MSRRSESVMFLTGAGVIPFRGFLIYFCLNSLMSCSSIDLRLLSVDRYSIGPFIKFIQGDFFVFEIQFKESHILFAVRAFQGPSEGMEDADEARDKVLGHVNFIEHMRHDLADSLEKAVKEGTVLEEEMPELLINGKDAVVVLAAEELEGHGGGAFLAVLDATGRAEAALAAERDELHLASIMCYGLAAFL